MKFRRLPLLLVLGAVLFLGLPSTAVFYTDWLWFKEVGFESVFLRTINAQLAVFGIAFVISFLFLFFNWRLARRALTLPEVVFGGGPNGRPVVVQTRTVSRLTLPIALIFALVIGYVASSDWLTWMTYFKAVPFGVVDPLFGRDVSFYVFRLPIYDTVRQQGLLLCFLALVGAAMLYLVSGKVVLEPRYGVAFWPRLRLVPIARRHVALLVALIFALMAWGAWLDIPRMLITQASAVYGASYSNVYADLPFLRLTIGALVLGCVLALWHGFGRGRFLLPVAIGLYLVVSVVGGVYSGFVQTFVVKPNEQDKELPFIEHNIAATRRAYALDGVGERQLSGDAELTAKDIIDNADTIQNVRLWDHQPLLQTFSQIQEIRTYYDFKQVDNDRYWIDGKYRQVMLSVRELNSDSLPNRSWVNEHLTFTHGYGLTLGPVNQVTTEGLPVLYIRNLPPESTVNIPVTEPSVYFGELATSYALVKTKQAEFDYPRGDDNVYKSYAGTGGVPVGGFFTRLLFALRFGTTDILVTREITNVSRMLFHRNIAERVRTIAPFLQYDADPYPVVYDGRLFWIQDAYTTTANYPYSTPAGGTQDLNYIRNSVKIVIDAYNGTTTFYLADPRDPIVQTIARVFPALFRPLSEMPQGLKDHIRYPEQIFAIQAAIFATYHMVNPVVFYNKEDQWQIPQQVAQAENDHNSTPMQPYYAVMKLPGESHTEFIQMLPFSPQSKDNLAAWMVARSDGANFGHLLSFQFPKQKIIYGPKQIVGRINQDQVISPQITLWNQQGSEVIWGTLLVIPIEESLLYVRPLYLRSPEGKIPELKRVIVAYQNQIVMEDTLTEGLVRIFGPSIAAALPPDRLQSSATSVVQATSTMPGVVLPPAPAAAPPEVVDLAAEVKDHFDRMQKAARDGDWALFGEEQKKLGAAIEKMARGKK